MPQLDVNIVMASPMFMDTFRVIRRASSVDDTGRTTSTDEVIDTTGIVQPTGNNTQERPKEYATGRKSCLVITAFRLREQTQNYLPDLVLWRGDTYLVETVEDYTNYGRGFVQASCTSEDLQDTPPGELPSVNPQKVIDGNERNRRLPAANQHERVSDREPAGGLASVLAGRTDRTR